MTAGSGFENSLVFAENADFSGNANPALGNGLQTNGQLWIGTTTPNAGGTQINVGEITSSTLTVGYSSPNITIEMPGGGSGIEEFNPDVGSNIVPDGGGVVAVTGT